MKKKQWKNVDTSTLTGLKQAEKLHAAGWTMYSAGLFILRFYRVVKS